MERLTEKSLGCFQYSLKDHEAKTGEFAHYDTFFDYNMAVKRLGEYEDTGLTPEEIKSLTELFAQVTRALDEVTDLIDEDDGWEIHNTNLAHVLLILSKAKEYLKNIKGAIT